MGKEEALPVFPSFFYRICALWYHFDFLMSRGKKARIFLSKIKSPYYLCIKVFSTYVDLPTLFIGLIMSSAARNYVNSDEK